MITSREQLLQLYAPPAERALLKQQWELDRHCLRFIALSPFLVMATGGPGEALLDASPRGGKPGFVKAPDANTLLIPDAGGNNRLDTLTNLLADPRIGLLFMIPGVDETLRVNGTARLRDEAAFTDLYAAERQRHEGEGHGGGDARGGPARVLRDGGGEHRQQLLDWLAQ